MCKLWECVVFRQTLILSTPSSVYVPNVHLKVGGYKTPFIVVGGVVIVTAVVSQFVLPKTKDLTVFTGSFLSLMLSPGCVIMYLVVVGSSMALSATDPLFAPYMHEMVRNIKA